MNLPYLLYGACARNIHIIRLLCGEFNILNQEKNRSPKAAE